MQRNFDNIRTKEFVHESIHDTVEEINALRPLQALLGVAPYSQVHQAGDQGAAGALFEQEGVK